MEKSYRELKGYAESRFIEKKSEFITYASPVESEEAAIQFINTIRKKHYDATHNCYAYILGESGGIQRSSDDGEPSGTAGIPMLEVLRKENLTNTVIVVTRYFGGIMLGAGGLVRAYSEGAAAGVRAAGILTVQPFALYTLSIDYTYLGKFQHELPKSPYRLADTSYADLVELKVLCPPEFIDQFNTDVMNWTSGNILVESKGIGYVKIEL